MIDYSGLAFLIITNVTMYVARRHIRRQVQPMGHRLVFIIGLAALGVYVFVHTESLLLEKTLSYLAVILYVALRMARAYWVYEQETKKID